MRSELNTKMAFNALSHMCFSAVPKNYQHVLAFVFAVNEVNDNCGLLPNTTLGFHIYDSYFNAKMTYQSTLNLLFNLKKIVPNYRCNFQKNLVGVIGGLDSETSLQVATLLRFYKIPQVGFPGPLCFILALQFRNK